MDFKMPEIKKDVNREPEGGKKKAGLLAGLLRWFGAAEGGAGGAAAGAGAGGLLATKAGVLGLILAGSAVAVGGSLWVSHVVTGSPDSLSGALSIFKSKPAASNASSLAPAAPNGQSASLQELAQAVHRDEAARAAASGAGAAGSAASSSARASDSVAGGSGGPINPPDGAGRVAMRHLDLSRGKFGGADKVSGGAVSSARVANVSPDASGGAARAAAGGSLGAFAKGARAHAGGARAFAAGSRARGGLSQAFGALRNYQANPGGDGGRPSYDGANLGSAGPAAGAPSAPAGISQGQQPTSLPNNTSPNSIKQQPAPPTPPAKNVTPWQNAINTAEVLLGLSTLLLFLMSKMKALHALRFVIGGLVAAFGAMVIALGAQIAGGPYGQTLQGGVLTAAGLGLIAAAAMAMLGKDPVETKANSQNLMNLNRSAGLKDVIQNGDNVVQNSDGTTSVASGTSTTTYGANGQEIKNYKPFGGTFGINPYVLIGGGAALIGIAAVNFAPPKSYPSQQFQNGNPPDSHWFGYRDYPSAKALNRFA